MNSVVARARRWVIGALVAGTSSALAAQTVVLDGPTAPTLPSVTPAFTLRATGFGPARPFLITLQIATNVEFVGVLALDSVFTSPDSVVAVQVTRPLPSERQVFWRARVRALAGPVFESAISAPHLVPRWLTLITPNSPSGDIFNTRLPLFVWRSAPITKLAGPWLYDVEISSGGRPQSGAAGLTDTTFRPPAELQANTSYRWNVRAYLRGGESFRVASFASFLIVDPPLPTTTIFYQNFPNPFPSATAFSTCFWFDVGEPGGRVSLDVLDLRGNLVRTLIPGPDGQSTFTAGRYGRGSPGAGSNCDNRFVWDATANDGRTVAKGIYLVKFQLGSTPPSIRRVFFLGR